VIGLLSGRSARILCISDTSYFLINTHTQKLQNSETGVGDAGTIVVTNNDVRASFSSVDKMRDQIETLVQRAGTARRV